MDKPHPIELRTRIMSYVEVGHGHRKTALVFSVSPLFANVSSPDFMCPFLTRSGGLVEVGLVPDAGGYDCTA